MPKCIKKDKHCTPSLCFFSNKQNYICAGISNKPTSWKDDIFWLCLRGKHAKTALEMTRGEALGIISALTANLFAGEELEREVMGIEVEMEKPKRTKRCRQKS